MRLRFLPTLCLLCLPFFACEGSDAPERLSVRLYFESDLGLPPTSQAPSNLRLSVLDRDTQRVIQRQNVALSSEHGVQAFENIPFGDNLQLFVEVLAGNNTLASGGSSHFNIIEGEDVIENLFIYLVEIGTFAPASGIFQGPAGGPVLQVNPSPFEGNQPRAGHTAVPLSDGRALIIGGAALTALGTGVSSSNIQSTYASIVVYDPRNGYFDFFRNNGTPAALNTGRAYHTTTALDDNRFLVTGGVTVPPAGDQLQVTNTVELIELLPDGTLSVTELSPMAAARMRHTASLLADGSVLILGGAALGTDGTPTPLSSSEVFQNGSFIAGGELTTGRYNHTAVNLADPNLIVTCGGLGISGVLASCELFTGDGIFVSVPSMATARHSHVATLLEPKDGRYVLLAGGFTTNDTQSPTATYEILDTLEGSFKPEFVGDSLKKARGSFDLVQLPDSADILLIGGLGIDATGTGIAALPEAELLANQTPGEIDYTSTLLPSTMSDIDDNGSPDGRFDHASVLLSNGMVLITGGARVISGATLSILYSDVFNPGPPNAIQ